MSDLDALLASQRSPEWHELERSVREGRAPQTLIAIVPDEEGMELARRYACMVLCRSHTGDDGCDVCRAWMDGTHPDFVVAGPGDRAPRMHVKETKRREIDEFQAALDLRPFIASHRIGVVPFAHKISPEGSNALLKTAEEPPAGSRLIFTASEDSLLPTIRSRAWLFAPRASGRAEPKVPPRSEAEWGEWFGRARAPKGKKKPPASTLYPDIEAWAAHLASRGEWLLAAALKDIIYEAEKTHLSAAMVQDRVFLVLKEGSLIERSFGYLREA